MWIAGAMRRENMPLNNSHVAQASSPAPEGSTLGVRYLFQSSANTVLPAFTLSPRPTLGTAVSGR